MRARSPGTAIDDHTLPPDWNGDRLDLHYAVSVLLQDEPRSPNGLGTATTRDDAVA